MDCKAIAGVSYKTGAVFELGHGRHEAKAADFEIAFRLYGLLASRIRQHNLKLRIAPRKINLTNVKNCLQIDYNAAINNKRCIL
jgi:hypothetical protein